MTRAFIILLDSYGYSLRSYSNRAIFINRGAEEIPIAFESQKKILEYVNKDTVLRRYEAQQVDKGNSVPKVTEGQDKQVL